MIFSHFYSDPHFGHANIIEFCDRPFANLDEMHSVLIERYNACVGPSDVVLWVGDVYFGRVADARSILDSLNGRKCLVRGNHDGTIARCLAMGFEFVADSLTLLISGRKVHVSHYPASHGKHSPHDVRYAGRRPVLAADEWLIHGHTHSSVRLDGRSVHVGVDAWDYYPVTYAQVARLLNCARYA